MSIKKAIEFDTNPPGPSTSGNRQDKEGYPLYPDSEDIYNQLENEEDIDPEFTSMKKTRNAPDEMNNELDFSEDESGDDLDVPGSDLDDEQEEIGNEDEENNYYSIGGDAHNDLDEQDGI